MTTEPSSTDPPTPDPSRRPITIDSSTRMRTKSDVEREILCEYIEQLEAELVRERQRREQVVAQYERLLEAERESKNESGGLLGRFL